jgi:hypothetical protein
MPFGFPSGWELVQEVCRGLRGGGKIRRVLESEAGLGSKQLNDFKFALEYSRQPSVDRFLEFRPEFLEVGKAAIAAALIPHENDPDLVPRERSWYDYLFDALMCQRERFSENKLAILTYNYDRSIEWFLIQSLTQSYGIPAGEAVRLLFSTIPIIHLHGSLGDLSERRYEPTLSPEAVRIEKPKAVVVMQRPNGDARQFRELAYPIRPCREVHSPLPSLHRQL